MSKSVIQRATRTLGVAALAAAIASVGACSRQPEPEEQAPVAERQQPVPPSPGQSSSEPATLTGCLNAGETEGTFVLTTTEEQAGETATYQVVGTSGTTLQDHVGDTVEVRGTIQDQGGVVAESESESPRKEGTGAEPQVETRTEVDFRRLNAQSVKPVKEGCEP